MQRALHGWRRSRALSWTRLAALPLAGLLLGPRARAADPPAAASPAPPAAPSASPAAPPPSAPAPAPAPGAPVAAKPAAAPPARPAALPALGTSPPGWERHIEVGGDVVFGERPTSHDANGGTSRIGYLPAVGFGLHARWEIIKYLRFTAYFADLDHHLRIPTGSLGLPNADFAFDSVQTFVFGARIAPTLPIGDRARVWASLGIGWGRFQFGRAQVTLPGQADFTLREQAFSFVEIPVGVGASFDIVKRWLSIDVDLTAATLTGQQGEALQGMQVVDSLGKVQHTTGFPLLDASFMQTIGLSLIL
jgi:hypothetical protein